ncbi:MAG TPA: hypothetical protein VK988_22410 [Acidimicrobiales bacterium]|nr:hypothetical protein [Acidimicrobiales bacterium]
MTSTCRKHDGVCRKASAIGDGSVAHIIDESIESGRGPVGEELPALGCQTGHPLGHQRPLTVNGGVA